MVIRASGDDPLTRAPPVKARRAQSPRLTRRPLVGKWHPSPKKDLPHREFLLHHRKPHIGNNPRPGIRPSPVVFIPTTPDLRRGPPHQLCTSLVVNPIRPIRMTTME